MRRATGGGNGGAEVHRSKVRRRFWSSTNPNSNKGKFPFIVCSSSTSATIRVGCWGECWGKGDEVERAYRRGDALEKRRRLMDAWAEFVEGTKADNVRAERRMSIRVNNGPTLAPP